MFHEGFYRLGFDFYPGVIHISEPMALSCSFEGAQCPTEYFLRVEVGHNRRDWGAHGSLMRLSVDTFVVHEVGGGKA